MRPTRLLPRLGLIYNLPPGGTSLPSSLLPPIPWQNCGMPNQTLGGPTPFTGGWGMLDREVYEWNRQGLAWEWGLLARLAIGPAGTELIAYDPFGWDPEQLRSTLGFGPATQHIREREDLVAYLNSYAAFGTDVYPPDGYTLARYRTWANAKINAHIRLCRKFRRIPVVLIKAALTPEAQRLQYTLVAEWWAKAPDVRWMIWDDESIATREDIHAGIASIVGALSPLLTAGGGGGGVTQ